MKQKIIPIWCGWIDKHADESLRIKTKHRKSGVRVKYTNKRKKGEKKQWQEREW